MSTKNEYCRFLAESRVFEGLSLQDVERVFDCGKVTTFPADHIVLQEGKYSKFIYVVFSGSLRVYLPKDQKRFSEIYLNELGPGACFGEYSFVDAKPASASVQTTLSSTVFELEKSNFIKFLEVNLVVAQQIYRNLLVVLVKRCRECNDELDIFTSL